MLRMFTVSITVDSVNGTTEVTGTSATVSIIGSEDTFLIDTDQIDDGVFTLMVSELDAYVITDEVKDGDKDDAGKPIEPGAGAVG